MKVAVLGTGSMGQAHLSAYRAIPGSEVVAVYSQRPERAVEVAREFGAEPCSDWHHLLKIPEIDAFDICLPSKNHHEVVIAALHAGKHVLCETPLTSRIDEATHMIVTAERLGLMLGTALLTPWVSKLAWMRDRVIDREFGDLTNVHLRRQSAPYRAPGSHHADALLELATFDFAYLDWLVGHPNEVLARDSLSDTGDCEHGIVHLAYPHGTAVTVEFSGLLPAGSPYECGVELNCISGSLTMSFVLPKNAPPVSNLLVRNNGETWNEVDISDHDPYLEEVRHFVNAVGSGAPLGPMNARTARRTLLVDQAVRRSIREGRSVPVESENLPTL